MESSIMGKKNESLNALVLITDSSIKEVYAFKSKERAKEQWQALIGGPISPEK